MLCELVLCGRNGVANSLRRNLCSGVREAVSMNALWGWCCVVEMASPVRYEEMCIAPQRQPVLFLFDRQDASLIRGRNSCGGVEHVELVVDVANVGRDGEEADAQLSGDFLLNQTFR